VPRRDFYATLGVRRDAPQADLKKAFRALAMQYHPDRNAGDGDAERRFREIAEAWSVLGDPEERTRYDRLGPLYTPDGRPPSPEDLGEFFSEALSGLFRRKQDSRGEDIKHTLRLCLELAADGGEQIITVQRDAICGRCGGDGAHPEGGKEGCEPCGGSGRSPTRRFLRSTCPSCNGRGFQITSACGTCHGEGRTRKEEKLKVKVPPGVATGQKLKLKERGHASRHGGEAGDLLIVVNVDEHPLFRRRGKDLICEVPLLFHEAALGTELSVPTLQGNTTILIPEGTESGKVFRLAGRGLRSPKSGKRGDLHIKVVVEVPGELTGEQRAAIGALQGRLDAAAHPRRQEYDKLLRERT
jgi:molecular chaperone DnaJ